MQTEAEREKIPALEQAAQAATKRVEELKGQVAAVKGGNPEDSWADKRSPALLKLEVECNSNLLRA
eukprot:546463-Amphidinium_carterae.1